MAQSIQSRTRTQIRQQIGRHLNDAIISTCTSNGGDAVSLLDTYGLGKFADNEVNGRQVYIPTLHTAGVPAGEKAWVSSFAAATADATIAPTFTANTISGGAYEMWKTFTVEEVHDAIDLAVMSVTDEAYQYQQDETIWTQTDLYEYTVPTGFKQIHRIEYVESTSISEQLESCDSVWTASTGIITATAATDYYREGSASTRLVVPLASATGLLATKTIPAMDIFPYNQLEIWVRSSSALAAADIQVVLDDTAACASPVETLDIPATSANTWTRHKISLADAYSNADIKIISVGLNMDVDKGAFFIWVDDIRVVNSASRIFRTLSPNLWSIVSEGSTDYIKLSPTGHNLVGANTLLRISGLRIPALMTTDTGTTGTSEVDPAWIIHQVSADLLIGHAKSRSLDIKDRQGLAERHQEQADKLRPKLRTRLKPNTSKV